MKPLTHLTDEELLAVARQARAMTDAPESAIQAAIALWPEARSSSLAGSFGALAGGVVKEGMRRLRAVLEVDSARTPAHALGLRSMPSGTRHLLFSVEGCDVDLRVTTTPQGHAVSGQVLGPEEGGRVELHASGDAAEPRTALACADLDALGEFHLPSVRATTGLISLHLPTMVIDLPEIDFGPPTE